MNDLEGTIASTFIKQGYLVLKNGWPDFLVVKQDFTEGFCVEVKSPTDRLSSEQKAMHQALRGLGISVQVLPANHIAVDEATGGLKNRGLLTPGQVANLLQVGEQTLALWRCTGRYNLPFIRCGRTIRYRATDLQRWLTARTACRQAEGTQVNDPTI